MRVLTVLLLAQAAALAGANREVGIFAQFEHAPSVTAVEVMHQELARLLEPTGLRPVWRALAEGTGSERFAQVLIVNFTGRCKAPFVATPLAVDPFREPTVLAATLHDAGYVLPLVEVECNAAQKGLDRRVPRSKREAALGRILGKVVAHELFHRLVNTVHHSAEGIARAILDWRDLSGDSQFGPREIEQIRRSLAIETAPAVRSDGEGRNLPAIP
jgi:hypothetical protein